MGNRTYLEGLASEELELFACRGDQAGVRPLAARLAAVRCGDLAAANAVLEAVAPWWQARDTPWSPSAAGALPGAGADDGHAEDAYRLSIERLRQCQVSPELARSHLLYGEWLRRQRHRRGAREQLRAAYELFGTLGMEAFADRAQAGLRTVGEHAATRPTGIPDTLTPQEGQIGRFAAEGAMHQEIAARLFVVPAPSTTTCVKHSGNSASPAGRSLPMRSARR